MSTWWHMSHTTARASSYEPGLICLSGAWAPGWNSGGGLELRVLAESHCSGVWACPHLCQRHSLTDSKMDWQILLAIASSKGLSPGNLLS